MYYVAWQYVKWRGNLVTRFTLLLLGVATVLPFGGTLYYPELVPELPELMELDLKHIYTLRMKLILYV